MRFIPYRHSGCIYVVPWFMDGIFMPKLPFKIVLTLHAFLFYHSYQPIIQSRQDDLKVYLPHFGGVLFV